MEMSVAFFLCTLALASAQLSTIPMWTGIGSQIISPLWKGLMGGSTPWMGPNGMSNMGAMNTMGTMGSMGTMWRTHPAFRMAAPPAVMSTGSASSSSSPASSATTTAGMSSPSEKTMPLISIPQNVINMPKVPSSEEILTHMVLASPKPYGSDHISDFLYSPETPKARTIMTPIYMTGMPIPMMRSSGNMVDDCTQQDMARWNRDMSEWVY